MFGIEVLYFSGYTWAAKNGGEGQVYAAGEHGVGAALLGANWGHYGYAGARASGWDFEIWGSGGDVGARGLCDHFQQH